MHDIRNISTWVDKIGNIAQVGGIETSVVDNGAGRNTRIAWINTGTGLRYKVVIDRGMDIVDAFYNQHSLAWLSHGGVMSPESYAQTGFDWLKTFSGGLMTTCGLTHVGGPEQDEFGQRGLHDQVSNIPARVDSVIQPDLIAGDLNMSISGTIRQTQVFGNRLDLKRKISGSLGSSVIKVEDEIINAGNEQIPHMILYHLNFGWPLIDEGARLLWNGNCNSRGGEMDDQLFGKGKDFKTCKPPLKEHSGTGEACGFVDVKPDKNGIVHCGVHNDKIGLALVIRFRKEQMPWLTNWQHWGRKEYVTALEPGTHPPIGQSAARAEKSLIFLEPGESRKYDLELEVMDDPKSIDKLISEIE
ncbi:MAG: aldose 1-epimerase family protein [Cyclobacteriaceae bacterium]